MRGAGLPSVMLVFLAPIASAEPLCPGPTTVQALTRGGAPLVRRERTDGAFLEVDGVATDVPWSEPRYGPVGFALADGRTLVYDPSYERSYLWDPGHRRLEPLRFGDQDIELTPIGSTSLLVAVGRSGILTYVDVPPGRGAVELWKPIGHGELVGTSDGTPVALDHHGTGTDVVCLDGPGAASRRPIVIPDGLWVRTRDSVCGRALLLVERLPHVSGGGWEQPPLPPVGVWRLDLATGERVRIGEAPVGITRNTAVEHATVDVRWGHEPASGPSVRIFPPEVATTWVAPEVWCLR